MRYKDHGEKYLLEKLMDAGAIVALDLKSAHRRLTYWRKQGYIKFRLKPPGMFMKVNDKEIAEIIKCFTPGGDGWWEPGRKYPVSKSQVAEVEGQDTEVTEGRSPSVVFDDSPISGGFTPFGAKPQGSLAY